MTRKWFLVDRFFQACHMGVQYVFFNFLIAKTEEKVKTLFCLAQNQFCPFWRLTHNEKDFFRTLSFDVKESFGQIKKIIIILTQPNFQKIGIKVLKLFNAGATRSQTKTFFGIELLIFNLCPYLKFGKKVLNHSTLLSTFLFFMITECQKKITSAVRYLFL